MNKVIVTTTINSPTKATRKFCEIAEKKDFTFYIIGDKKTPHHLYHNLAKEFSRVIYVDPDYQEKNFSDLSNVIGWNTIQRRNIGFVMAFKNNFEIIATVDDDNVPYEAWGDNILINKKVEVNQYKNVAVKFFDPLSVTVHKHLYHRGYPLECIAHKNNIQYIGKVSITPLVQADLWDGDPDIDAMCRLINQPIVKFDSIDNFTSDQIMPFNSQNTFLHRSILKDYCVLPFVGRMDDIWAAYIYQHRHPSTVVFSAASVYQERNKQDLIKNLESEILGYRETLNLLNNIQDWRNYLPDNTKKFLDIYRSYFEN